ncbi:MAG: choice-of-anchor B family protein [Bacteroidetes bacterium]|nr:choice-of-anchor B family protein [Bacteroidota bacterium]
MLRVLAVLLALLVIPVVHAQTLDLVGTVSFEGGPPADVGGADVWDYIAPDSTEYVLVGVYEGMAVVRLPDLTAVAMVPGPQDGDLFYHRDIKTVGTTAYVVSGCTGTNEGLQIIDLSGLPRAVELVNTYAPSGLVTSHNLAADPATGLLYLIGPGINDVRIVDVSDPLAPFEVAFLDIAGAHDLAIQDGRLYVAESVSESFSIWDVTDADQPSLLSRFSVPGSGYVHNAVPFEDGSHVVTSFEAVDQPVRLWDISDPTDPMLVGSYVGPGPLTHNVRVQGDHLFIAHWTAGMVVVDVSDPSAPATLIAYDTFPANDAAEFQGSRGITTASPNSYVAGIDLDGTLTVLLFDPIPVVNEPEVSPRRPMLDGVYPNPFTEEATIRYSLSKSVGVRLAVYDLLGREVALLSDRDQSAGLHTAVFDASELPVGVYVIILDAGGQKETQRVSLMR